MTMEWNDEHRKVFSSNKQFQERYCRRGRFSTLGPFGNNEHHIAIRREIASFLSERLPESFHRTPGHGTNQADSDVPKWLIVGRLKSRDGKIYGDTRLEVLYLDQEYFLSLKLEDGMNKQKVTWKSLKCCQDVEMSETAFQTPDRLKETVGAHQDYWAMWNIPKDFSESTHHLPEIEGRMKFFEDLLGSVNRCHARKVDIVQNFLKDRGHSEPWLLFPAAELPLD